MSDDDKIIRLVTNTEETTQDIDPNKILEAATGNIREVVLIGTDTEGMFYLASSTGSAGEMLLFLEVAKKKVLELVAPEE